MKELNKEIANAIVEQSINLINYNINIMNNKGEIVASGNKERIGKLHEGAVLAINRCSMVLIKKEDLKNLKGTCEGVNIPFYCRGELIGVIGVTGNCDEVIKYAQLIKMTAELYVEKELLIEEQIKHRELKEKFYLSLLKNKNDVFNANIISLYSYKLKLEEFHSTIIIKIFNKDFVKLSRDITIAIKIIDSNYINFYITEDGDKIVFVVTSKSEDKLKKKREIILSELEEFLIKNKILEFKLYVGAIYKEKIGIHKSYITAKNISNIKFIGDEKILYSINSLLEVVSSKVDKSYEVEKLKLIWEKLIAVDNNYELRETINTFYKYNCENTLVAKKMNIHRNTLNYRLGKIEKITGKNPKYAKELFLLLLAQTIYLNY